MRLKHYLFSIKTDKEGCIVIDHKDLPSPKRVATMIAMAFWIYLSAMYFPHSSHMYLIMKVPPVLVLLKCVWYCLKHKRLSIKNQTITLQDGLFWLSMNQRYLHKSAIKRSEVVADPKRKDLYSLILYYGTAEETFVVDEHISKEDAHWLQEQLAVDELKGKLKPSKIKTGTW